ncbi:hypothetical protein NPIL_6841 [Nephila pilipes]|uniref:Uncharacterized protein n=1 Tax=Nephila pilipes TaxID=299642 RepID=A0A8X6J5J4_NEPPI|nr:hypothetical protein NPIL_6841 [Nephila pilipes]
MITERLLQDYFRFSDHRVSFWGVHNSLWLSANMFLLNISDAASRQGPQCYCSNMSHCKSLDSRLRQSVLHLIFAYQHQSSGCRSLESPPLSQFLSTS